HWTDEVVLGTLDMKVPVAVGRAVDSNVVGQDVQGRRVGVAIARVGEKDPAWTERRLSVSGHRARSDVGAGDAEDAGKQAYALLVNCDLDGFVAGVWVDLDVDIRVRVIEPVALSEVEPFRLGVAACVGVAQLGGGGERGKVGGSLRVPALRDPEPDVDDDRADQEDDGRAHNEEDEHLAAFAVGPGWARAARSHRWGGPG